MRQFLRVHNSTLLVGLSLVTLAHSVALGDEEERLPPYAIAVLEDNPIAYWRLGENLATTTAFDEARDPSIPQIGAQDGLYSGGVVRHMPGPRLPVFKGFGSDNKAAEFSGAESIAFSNVFNALNTLRPQAVTVEAWIRNDDLVSRQIIFRNNIATQMNGIALYLEDATIQMAARSSPADPSAIQQATGPFLTTGQWRHVVGIADFPNDEMRVYVDGLLAGTVDRGFAEERYTPGVTAPVEDSFIGQVPTGFFFDGLIDEVALYDRGLSDSEILEHYFIAIGETLNDCNENGTLDHIDLISGESADCNGNHVPDECESLFEIHASGNCNGLVRAINALVGQFVISNE